MFYLTTHSTHFTYGYMVSDMVKDHSDSERGNMLPPHGLLLSINSRCRDRTASLNERRKEGRKEGMFNDTPG